MVKCKTCGAELGDTQKFCNQCGQPQLGDTPEITWTGRAAFAKNPLVYRGYLILFVLAAIFGVLISIVTGTIMMLYLLIIIAIVLILLFILASIIMDWVSVGGIEIQGFVNKEGVAHRAGSGTRMVNRGSLLFGILSMLGGARSGLTAFGGSLLATSQEENSIPWKDVTSVKVYPKNRVIVLRDVTYVNGVVLYCTKENFDRVLDIIQQNIPKAVKFKK